MRTLTLVMAALGFSFVGCADPEFRVFDAPAPPTHDASTDACSMTTWYADCDGDGVAALTGQTMSSCEKPAAGTCGGTWVATMPIAGSADCNDTRADVHPGASETCDSVDNNCNGQIDENGLTTFYLDMDSDGHGNPLSSMTTCNAPSGYVTSGDDCDDLHANVHPGATEVCDTLDNNCNSAIDEGVTTTYYRDLDSDGHGNAASSTSACSAPSGYVATSDDCNDNSNAQYPGHPETCDTLDNNCNNQVDEGVQTVFYRDLDGDGHGNASSTVSGCSAPVGYVGSSDDCNDNSNAQYPGHVEVCDTVDNNCNNQIDEGVQTTFYRDADGDGYGNANMTTTGCSPPATYVADATDCNDSAPAVHPNATEVCFNNTDDNCSGSQDEVAQCSMDCDWDGTRWLSWGYDGTNYFSVGAWVTCKNSKLNSMYYVNNSGNTQPAQTAGGTSTSYVDCNWGAANRWASQGEDAPENMLYGSDLTCDGTRVTKMSWGNSKVWPGQIQGLDMLGQLACNWNGAIYLTHGIDGPCAFLTGFVVTCSNGHLTDFSWNENAGCPKQRL